MSQPGGLNAATIEILLSKGLSGDDLLAVAKAMESSSREQSSGAKRQARYRKRKSEGVTSDVTSDVTEGVTSPPKEYIQTPCSEPNGSGGPAADPVKELFDLGVSILTATGTPEMRARTLLGKWRKSKGEVEVLKALLECRARAISQPIEWIEARFKTAKYVSASGYEYRSSDPETVMREAEKRADWSTYWGAKSDRDRQRTA